MAEQGPQITDTSRKYCWISFEAFKGCRPLRGGPSTAREANGAATLWARLRAAADWQLWERQGASQSEVFTSVCPPPEGETLRYLGQRSTEEVASVHGSWSPWAGPLLAGPPKLSSTSALSLPRSLRHVPTSLQAPGSVPHPRLLPKELCSALLTPHSLADSQA